MKKLFITFFMLLIATALSAQENLGPIKWISFEEAEKLDSVENRPFLIDVYTDWCGWCKRMMATTFQNQNLASYINNNFYCIRFNAETSDTIKFQGKEYVSDGRVNALAPHFLGSHLSYPTIVYIDREKRVAPIPGFMTERDIEPILVYFAENISNYSELEVFKDLYMLSFPTVFKDQLEKNKSPKADTLGKIEWKTMTEANTLYKKEKRPILVDVYVDDRYRGYVPYITMNSMVHERAVLKDKALCDYINQNFYPIRIEATTTDSLYWFDIKEPFVSTGKDMPNQFTNFLMKGDYKFPAMFFFDKDLKYIGNISNFFMPSFWLIILKFYSTEAYKDKDFQKFYLEQTKNQ